MAAIDIGPGASDRGNSWDISGYTIIDKTNPANDAGTLTSFELWYNSGGGNAANVKIGTFSGSGTSYDDRDYETLGTVTAGSKQTFSGKDCDVTSGDFLGIYQSSAWMESEATGGSDCYYYLGDAFGGGAQTYTLVSSWIISIYGTGVPGWLNIGKVSGATATDLAKVNSVAVGDISKLNGVSV